MVFDRLKKTIEDETLVIKGILAATLAYHKWQGS